MTSAPVRLVLVDDQELVRAGFRMVLDTQEDLEVVGEAADGEQALDLLARTRADVVLMDIRMPRMDGVTATRRLLDRPGPSPRVLVLTTFDLDEYVYAALRAGASGFLLKDCGPEELLAAVRAVEHGDSVLAPSATRRLLEHVVDRLPDTESGRDGARRAALAPLTPRELEVLAAVGEGLSNGEIAAALFLAEATVKTHIGHILGKLQLRDRVQMVILAYESGLVEVRPRS
ncbi:response regulator transcription factor [Phycicoccus endophyticus]|uniref:Response regulator transcription factor n=1 Tax=Phycicoccus endophyticus TaxID=1690220 RepID=A0A7G9R165_9MICO|nr:response regulator transcription factor [Phycicoccus endophyticus]NHI20528.1 response regulator transcription factor [Phycicoccus endophyticus]QNN49340.1 response regulator transcription factor [Phycicoccus endophyticus]GGL45238.1 DNA-binding response regulator [Phycicoccus endophyticus]